MPNESLTYMAFDFGTKRIGMAVGQTLTGQAQAINGVDNRHNTPDWPAIHAAIDAWEPHALVVGIPLNMDGSPQPVTGRAKQFAQALQTQTQLEVHEADERQTTLEAKSTLFEQGGSKALKQNDIDSVAAQCLLQSFLQNHSHKEQS